MKDSMQMWNPKNNCSIKVIYLEDNIFNKKQIKIGKMTENIEKKTESKRILGYGKE